MFDSKRKNSDKPKGRPGSRLFAVAILGGLLAIGFLLLRPRFTPMSDIPTADLVYAEVEGEVAEIYVRDFETGIRTPIYTNPGIGLPQAKRYSPIDPSIINIEWLEEEGVSRLFIEDLRGQEPDRTIGTYSVFYDRYSTINWSSDGQWVAFAAHPYDPQVDTDKEVHRAEIWMVHITTGEIKRLTNNTYPDRYPAFSPDGTRIAYMSSPEGSPRLYVMDVATGESRQLAPDQDADKPGKSFNGESYLRTLHKSADHPSWSPDGQWIAYQVLRNPTDDIFYLNLYVIRADGAHNQAIALSEKNSVVHVWKS